VERVCSGLDQGFALQEALWGSTDVAIQAINDQPAGWNPDRLAVPLHIRCGTIDVDDAVEIGARHVALQVRNHRPAHEFGQIILHDGPLRCAVPQHDLRSVGMVRIRT